MGGRGSGGKRVGAGRKAKTSTVAKLHGSRQRGARAAVQPESGAVVLQEIPMPDDLPPAQAKLWLELAPLALAARTLTVETVGSFVDLCRVIARRNQIEQKLDEDGLMIGVEKHPLMVELRTYEQRVEAGRARFLLAPMGKPLLPDAPAEADPFEQFDGLKVMKGGRA